MPSPKRSVRASASSVRGVSRETFRRPRPVPGRIQVESFRKEAPDGEVSEKWPREEAVRARPLPRPARTGDFGAARGSRGEETGLQLFTQRSSGVYSNRPGTQNGNPG